MARLIIRIHPDPVLKTVAKVFTHITESDHRLAHDMVETMHSEGGVGLAAPQVGISKRLIVCSPKAKKGEENIFFNPVIIQRSGEEMGSEGCLSLPGISADIKRSAQIELEALNLKGEAIKFQATGFLARIIQHEIDHLDGMLFIDRVAFKERKDLITIYQETRIL